MSLPGNAGSPPHDDALVASAVRAVAVARDDCPDAEVLGIYVERALDDAGERQRVEAHVVECARCQAIVADYVRALPDAPAAAAGAAPTSVAGWLSGWRWLVPLASAAVVGVVAVWIGRGPSDEVAEQTRASTAARATPVDAPPVAEAPVAQFQAPPGAVLRSADPADVPRALPPARAQAPLEAEEAAKLTDRQANLEQSLAKTEADVASSRDAARSPAAAPPAAPAPALPQTAAALGTAGEQRPATTAAQLERRAADTPEQMARQRVESTREISSAASRVNPAPASPAAPGVPADTTAAFRADSGAAWRVRDGRIERTLDAGATWSLAATPAGVRVVVAASVSIDVCWALADRAVLRTIDGTTWTPTTTPGSERLTSLTAVGPNAATVATASGVRWTTSDGGASWRRQP